MANKLFTVFQNLDKAISGNWENSAVPHVNSYDLSNAKFDRDIIYRTDNKVDLAKTKLEMQQNKWLSNRWRKANADLSVQAFSGLNNVKLMYRDADLMDAFPEIGAALDIVTEESCLPSDQGQIVNVYSKSTRIKSVLEDLFVNRLDMQIMAPMIIRGMCKYGNQFMLLNIDNKQGILGWRQLPVFNVERLENGIENQYGARYVSNQNAKDIDMSTKFVWADENSSQVAFRNWQIGHFRLLTDSIYLPYGVSYLHKARRHFRMLSLMEDMMLIYRLERSVERRVYKIFVGAIDDADVKAYVEDIANEFKRTPIVDPMTGQIDLRKNILPVWKKTPIPLLDGRTITIEELAKEFEDGKENYVYSIQDKTLQVVGGKVVWCGKNYHCNSMVKITLDDDSYCVMAPEHEFIMRDGSKKRADELQVGESVMPYYTKLDKNSEHLFDRYQKIYNPSSGKYEHTHRLIAKEILKDSESYNTVHHKDFNKYNNNPTNLLWCDYFEHHKMHGELARLNWADKEKNIDRRRKLSESTKKRFQENPITQEMKNHLSKVMKDKYASGELDWLKIANSERNRNRIVFDETREKIRQACLAVCYPDRFRKYNESELHTQHNAVRREKMKSHWLNEDKNKSHRLSLTVKFDDKIWGDIRNAILYGEINNRKTMLEFINSNLIDYLISINSNKRLEHNHFISREVLEGRIRDIGFATITEYIEAQKKNHKIKSIEYIGDDDVYCMTVVGLNGEDDRHNFAIRTFNQDDTVNENGCFVSNCADQDIFIPVRSENAPTPIDTLPAAQNLTAMDDIKFVQNKVLTALRIPKAFLNFEDAVGDGKNLALMDIRFTRTINRIQQAFLMELTKIAQIHLFILGFDDELTNFSLSMNNPSTQAESLQIENVQKKISAMRDAVADPGTGIPLMSQTRALKEIMKWSDKDIQENLEEIRLEKALAAELEKTTQIIKRTGIFDSVDRMYGESGAEYADDQQAEGGDEMGGDLGGGGGGMPPMGDDIGGAVDGLGMDGMEEGEIGGQEGEVPIQDNGGEGGMPPMESVKSRKPLLNESKTDKIFLERFTKRRENINERVKVFDTNLLINEDIDNMIKSLDKVINEK